MNVEELKKNTLQWGEENEKKRAVILITIEKDVTDEKGKYDAQITSLVNGDVALCSEALKEILTYKNENNIFRKIYQNVRANINI